jgi:hypothetical protein
MRLLIFLSSTICLFPLALAPLSLAQTSPYPANATFFSGDPPSLVTAGTRDSDVNWPESRYYFTFNVPATSGTSLGKVTITPEPNPEVISFMLDKTEAFQGTQNQRGAKLALGSMTQDPQSQSIIVTFAKPAPPGTTFTIVLQTVQNPSLAGTYLFRVQAFPSGPEPVGFDLGVGRFTFYQRF